MVEVLTEMVTEWHSLNFIKFQWYIPNIMNVVFFFEPTNLQWHMGPISKEKKKRNLSSQPDQRMRPARRPVSGLDGILVRAFGRATPARIFPSGAWALRLGDGNYYRLSFFRRLILQLGVRKQSSVIFPVFSSSGDFAFRVNIGI